MSTPRVMVAMPAMGFMPTISHVAILGVHQYDFARSQFIKASAETSCTLVSEARNDLARRFLAFRDSNGQPCTHLLFVDSDMTPPKDGLLKLVEAEKDIVSGLCTNRSFDQYTPVRPEIRRKTATGYENIMDLPETMEGLKKLCLLEIDAVGMAWTLIRREVLEKLPDPWFEFARNPDGKGIYGEDFRFCEAAKAAGFSIWCRVDCVVGHVGNFVYDIADHWQCRAQGMFDKKE